MGHQERDDIREMLEQKVASAVNAVDGFELRELDRIPCVLPGQWIP